MSVGSGNIGATNVVRVLGKGPGYLVFFLDMLKGLIPALIARWLFPDNQEYWFFAGMFAVIGHSLSPFLKFKGGKGISTALGMTLGSSPVVALIALGIFLAILLGTGYVSLASIFAVVSTTPMSILFRDSLWVTIGFAALSVFVIYRHKANIIRLRNGTESKFIRGKTRDKDSSDGES
jgi:glycerol-3-phosphate acyltransferase PlsY